MSNEKLLEEIERMNYLFGYKKGKVISEQSLVKNNLFILNEKKPSKGDMTGVLDRKKISSKPINWKRRSEGALNFMSAGETKIYLAVNVNFNDEKYKISSFTNAVKLESTPEKELINNTPPEIERLPPLSLKDDNFPYDDNTIGPNFVKYTKAKKAFTDFINKIINFVDSDCIDNLKEIKIQGFADSAKPTNTNNDHSKFGFSKPYDGLIDNNERNLFLANNRAKNILNLIVSIVKKQTKNNVDLTSKMTLIPGVSYYGQGKEKRGGEFRRVDIIVDSQNCQQKPIEIGGTSTSSKIKPDDDKEEMPKNYINLSPYGPNYVPAQYVTVGGKQAVKITKEVVDKYNLSKILPLYDGYSINEKVIVDAKIDGDEFIVDDFSFGKFVSANEFGNNYKYDESIYLVTFGRPVIINTLPNGDIYLAYLQFGLMV